jgi:hypothetical protein
MDRDLLIDRPTAKMQSADTHPKPRISLLACGKRKKLTVADSLAVYPHRLMSEHQSERGVNSIRMGP